MAIHRVLDRFVWGVADAVRPDRGVAHLHREAVVNASIANTFAFFSDAANLERLTPSWLNFQVRTPLPLVMCEGLEIDYQIVVHGWPIPWRTRIDVWQPRMRFVDRQLIGPYRWWHHEHRFESAGDQTRIIDHVEFVPRIKWLSAHLVRRDVERIFDYRQTVLQRVFSGSAKEQNF